MRGGLLAFAIACAPRITGPSVYGTWRVADVLCTGCDHRVPAERGTVIRFGKNAVANPLAGNCDSGADYHLLRRAAGPTLSGALGRPWPDSIQRIVAGRTTAIGGFITCGGVNYMQVVFISEHTAFYLYEGGIVFVLESMTRDTVTATSTARNDGPIRRHVVPRNSLAA